MTTAASLIRAVGWLAAPVLRPFPRLNAKAWDFQYRLGIWDVLDVVDGAQMLGLVEEFAPNASILDLGCGTSANLPLRPGRYSHYHGVDISVMAVDRARKLGRPGTSFETADILTYETHRRYDAILFREVLMYFPADKTAKLLRHVAGFLKPDGRIFVQSWLEARAPHTTPTEFIEVVRNCGLPVVAERPRLTAQGGPAGSFIVLAQS